MSPTRKLPVEGQVDGTEGKERGTTGIKNPSQDPVEGGGLTSPSRGCPTRSRMAQAALIRRTTAKTM